MPSQTNVNINHFNKGLITEASPLDFPIGASVDEINMKLLNDGTRERRLGLDVELNGVAHDTGMSDEDLRRSRIKYHDWLAPNNDPNLHIGCTQIGSLLYFIDVTKPNPSAYVLNQGNAIDLNLTDPRGQIDSAVLNGYLVITSADFDNPIYLSYDPSTDTVTKEDIEIKIRDFYGVDDTLDVNDRPVTLSEEHKYNLINQGWIDSIITKGTEIREEQSIGFPEGVGPSSGTIVVGGITVGLAATDNPWDCAAKVAAAIDGQVPNNATYPIQAAAFSSNIIKIIYDKRDGDVSPITVIDSTPILAAPVIISTNVEGEYTLGGNVLDEVFDKLGYYPSNSDVWALGKIPDDTDENVNKFDPLIWERSSLNDTGEAPKGHVIISAFDRASDRDNIVSGVNSDEELGKISVCCSHAGRIFYSGIQSNVDNKDERSPNFSGAVFFTQIIDSDDKFHKCYQVNDPTNIDRNDVLPSDGGVIQIPNLSLVTRMISSEGNLFLFSERGVWQISAEGGFTATNFQVNKISNIGVISPHSIVEINGLFVFWSREGIYRLERNEYGRWDTNSITEDSIQRLFNSFADESKRYVKGFYDISKNQIRWLLYSEGEKQLLDPVDNLPVTIEPPPPPTFQATTYSFPGSLVYNTKAIQWTPNKFIFFNVRPTKSSANLGAILIEDGIPSVSFTPFTRTSVSSFHGVRYDDDSLLTVSHPTSNLWLRLNRVRLNPDGTWVSLASLDINAASLGLQSNSTFAQAFIHHLEGNYYAVFWESNSPVTWRKYALVVEFDGTTFTTHGWSFLTEAYNTFSVDNLGNNLFLIRGSTTSIRVLFNGTSNPTMTVLSISSSQLSPPINGPTSVFYHIWQSRDDPRVYYSWGVPVNDGTAPTTQWGVSRFRIPNHTDPIIPDNDYYQQGLVTNDYGTYWTSQTDFHRVYDTGSRIMVLKSNSLIPYPGQAPLACLIPKVGREYDPSPDYFLLSNQPPSTSMVGDQLHTGYSLNDIIPLSGNRHAFLTGARNNNVNSNDSPNLYIFNA